MSKQHILTSSSTDKSLSVALIQPDLEWLNPSANMNHLAALLCNIPQKTDIVILPEMFTSGFTEKPEVLDGHQQTIEWMKAQASLHDVAITGSIACQIREEKVTYFVNRLLFVLPSGDIFHYDKCHLFQMGGEHERYRPGNKRCIIEYNGWRLLMTVCYDIRFPVFCRNQQDYDVIFCVANWPAVRSHPWRTLLQARAIENQAYVLGVNRVGEDGNGLLYNGDSLAVDYKGMILADGGEGRECVLTVDLLFSSLARAREDFPVWKDADNFQLL